MYRMMNMTDVQEDMERFRDDHELKEYCRMLGLDGIEYQKVMNEGGVQDTSLIYGVHLSSLYSWVDFWRGNEDAILKEYGNWETIEQYYGGRNKEAVYVKTKRELDYAKEIGAKYVVYHICEVRLEDVYYRKFPYSDEEVVDTAAEIINEMLDGADYEFDFLMENLWWPGLNLQNPEVTGRLLEKVHYPKKGIMLDTGHLMNANWNLRTQDEAADYIMDILEKHKQYLPYIKGMHLNASLSGEFVSAHHKEQHLLKENYWERWGDTFGVIFQTDQHQPFTAKRVLDIIEKVQPEYLTYELISNSREEHETLMRVQRAVC